RETAPIRNVFRGASSLIARCFLLRSNYGSLEDLRKYALDRIGPPGKTNGAILTKGTVSKVVKTLEEEQIIARMPGGLKLIDADELLEKLRTNYREPIGSRLTGKTILDVDSLWQRLTQQSIRAVTTGDASAAHYRVLSGDNKLKLYVD